MSFELKQHFQIESARFLPNLPKGHPCGQTHGHSFKIILTLKGPLQPNFGWVQDYNEISDVMRPILKKIDHTLLNNVQGLENPTSELLAQWIFNQAKPGLEYLKSVSILETPLTECTYFG